MSSALIGKEVLLRFVIAVQNLPHAKAVSWLPIFSLDRIRFILGHLVFDFDPTFLVVRRELRKIALLVELDVFFVKVPQRIEDRRFPAVVRTNQQAVIRRVECGVFDRAIVVERDFSDFHDARITKHAAGRKGRNYVRIETVCNFSFGLMKSLRVVALRHAQS